MSQNELDQIKLCGIDTDHNAKPRFFEIGRFSTRVEEKELFGLASILFDPLAPEYQTNVALEEAYRLENLSSWLKRNLASCKIDTKNPIVEALLLRNDLRYVSNELSRLGYPRLAVLVTMASCNPPLRQACFENQLIVWKDASLPDDVRMIFEILSGRIEAVLAKLGSPSWIVDFAAYFWFGLGYRPFDRLVLGLQRTQANDMRYSLLAFFGSQFGADLPPVTLESTLSQLKFKDSRVSWIFSKLLCPLKIYSGSDAKERLASELSEQLEWTGNAQMATSLKISRSAEIASRHNLEIGQESLNARVWQLKSSLATPIEQFNACISAKDWFGATELIGSTVGLDALLSNSESLLYTLLHSLPAAHFDRIAHRPATRGINQIVAAILYYYLTAKSDNSLINSLLACIKAIKLHDLHGSQYLKLRVCLSEISLQLAHLAESHQIDLGSLYLLEDHLLAFASSATHKLSCQ